MKESLEKKYIDKNITEEETALYKKSLWIKKGIIECVYLFMIIFSFIRIFRMSIFYDVLGGGRFSFYAVSIVIYYITLFLSFFYFTFQISYMIYCKIMNEDFLELITKLNIKLDIYSFLCKCLSILLFIMIYITTPCTVVGHSMDNTFHEGDRVLCTGLFFNPSKDDVIVFDASRYTTQESFFIKRITAIEGDTILYSKENDKVYINDEEYRDITLSNFKKVRESAGISDESCYSFSVPEGMLMVMGDNRANGKSYDSREFGLIYAEDVFGKVYVRIFPFPLIFKCSYNYE